MRYTIETDDPLHAKWLLQIAAYLEQTKDGSSVAEELFWIGPALVELLCTVDSSLASAKAVDNEDWEQVQHWCGKITERLAELLTEE